MIGSAVSVFRVVSSSSMGMYFKILYQQGLLTLGLAGYQLKSPIQNSTCCADQGLYAFLYSSKWNSREISCECFVCDL
jgi:hypothetical protein